MYEQFKFVEEAREETSDLNQVLEWITNRKLNTALLPIGGILVSDNGLITYNGIERPCTQWAFEKFCGNLGIPRPFARKIPPDLLLNNIRRLIQESAGKEIQIHDAEKGIVGVASKNYYPIDNEEFTKEIVNMNLNPWQLKTVHLFDRGISAYFINARFPKLEPIKGDITEAGLVMRNSDTGGSNLTSKMFLYRLVCSNGAVIPEEWGSIKRLVSNKISKEKSLLNFVSRTKQLETNFQRLTDFYIQMTKMNITDVFLKESWNSVVRVIKDDKETDEVFGIDEDRRKQIFLKIKVRDKENKKRFLIQESEEMPEQVNFTYYDIYNKISAAGKERQFEEKYEMEKISGDIFKKIKKISF